MKEHASIKVIQPHVARWLMNDASAIVFITMIYHLFEVWDDLIDKDEVEPGDINTAFYNALIELPRNAFYVRNFTTLSAILDHAITDWHVANEFEKSKEINNLHRSYVLRSSYFGVLVAAARIVGGPNWAQSVSLEMRKLEEPWDKYAAEFGVSP